MRAPAALLAAVLSTAAPAQTDPFETAFTYQARLTDAGAPYNGPADVNAYLFDVQTGGTKLAVLSFTSVNITDGLLTLDLDFGELPAETQDLWLEFEIDTGAGFATLTPRQRVSPAPRALSLRTRRDTAPTFEFEEGDTSPNIVAGHTDNRLTELEFGQLNVAGSVIAGGGGVDFDGFSHPNIIYNSYATISGGRDNLIDGTDIFAGRYGVIAGGQGNLVQSYAGTVGGGENNAATGYAPYATVAGGAQNTAGAQSTTVSGGESNTAQASYATISGGFFNNAGASYSTIGGGYNNATNGAASFTTIAGGYGNAVTSSYGAIPGGLNNEVNGAYSIAAGRRAHANHDGVFVFADNTNADFTSTAASRFLVRAARAGFGTADPQTTLHVHGASATDGLRVSSVANPDYATLSPTTLFASNSHSYKSNGNITLDSAAAINLKAAAVIDIKASSLVDITGPLINLNSQTNVNSNLIVTGNAFKPGGGLWSALSDARVKKNIRDLEGSLELVNTLHPVRYEYTDPDHWGCAPGEFAGFVAQEVQRIEPDWVNESDDGLLTLSPQGLEAHLVAAVQDLTQQLHAERAKNADLEQRLQRLEKALTEPK